MTSAIKFRPRRGAHYGTGTLRPLIVGDSHYDKDKYEAEDLTEKVICKWIRGGITVPFYTRLGRVLENVSASDQDREAAFARVAFYSFLQILAGESATAKASPQRYGEAQAAFIDVLQELNPTHVLVTGTATLRKMPPYDRGGNSGLAEQHGGKELWVGAYRTPSGFAWTTSIPHASRLSPPQWAPAVASFLAKKPA